ncbi:ABC transporter permease [Actinomadura roseirufa]|uniref:ABC transporter permease n=1 Tax=Actinomadura roseirufa TaxID=2094049 RepID=UPI001040FD4C|nr:ABC transporter permease [Actinomadura roseirufa]
MTAVHDRPAALLEPARPPLARLVAVELRKMVDTRAGRWMLVLIGLTAVAMVPVVLFAEDKDEQSLGSFFIGSQTGVNLLLPVLGILSVTSEWSQRTALATFTLVPERGRVLAAKLLGGACLAAGFAAVGVVVAFLGRVTGATLGRSGGSWSPPPQLLGGTLLYGFVVVAMGVAYGMLFMNSPLAIVLYFLLPTLWSTLGPMVEKLEGPAGWFDTNKTLATLMDPGVTLNEWARIATSLAVWLVLPLVFGAMRLARREVK